MTGAGDAGPGVAASSIIGDHHADDSLIAVFGAACAEAARLDTEATHAVRRGTMYALDDRIGQLRADCARLAAELAAARAEVERLAGDLAEWMQHVAEVNAHALRMQDRAVAAERERDEARAVLRRCEEGLSWCPECAVHLDHGISHAPGCALAAALDPPPRGATGPSGTRDGRGEVGRGTP